MAHSPVGQLTAAVNPLLGSKQAAQGEHYVDPASPDPVNVLAAAVYPRATETPSWMPALSLEGTPHEGVIGTQDDADFFRIDVEELTMAEITTSADFLRETVLLDSEGQELVSSGGFVRRLLPTGRYYLRVSAYRYPSSTERASGSFTVVAEGTSASPAPIMLGEHSYESSIDSGRDQAYFQFDVTEPTEVDIYTIGGLDSVGRLFDSSGRWLAEVYHGGDESNFRIQRIVWPGQYYVEVSGNGGESGSFTLKAEGTQLPSDPIQQRGSLGNIEQQFESDYFRFEIADGSEAVIYTEGNLDTVGELLDARGNFIEGSDSGGEGSNFRMRSVLAQPGVYYLMVRAWDGSTGEYTVHAERTPLSAVELSPSGSVQEGAIEAEGDRDYFHFEVSGLTEAAIYTVGGFDSYGKLLDAEGREITSNDDGGDKDNFRIETLLWPGDYYVWVSSSFSASTGSYTLHLEGAQPLITTLGLDGSPHSGGLMESGESNFFLIETTAPTAAMIYTAGDVDTAGVLYDFVGNEIASNDDGGEQFVNFRIVAILLRPGGYILRAFSSSGHTGSYTIRADGIVGQ